MEHVRRARGPEEARVSRPTAPMWRPRRGFDTPCIALVALLLLLRVELQARPLRLLDEASTQLRKSGRTENDRYTTIRKAQVRDAKQMLAVLAALHLAVPAVWSRVVCFPEAPAPSVPRRRRGDIYLIQERVESVSTWTR